MNKVLIVSACRTPIGSVPGNLSGYSDMELMAACFREAVKRIDLNDRFVEEAFVGSSFPSERDNICRKILHKANMDSRISASTTDKTCASAIQALSEGAYKIMAGDADIVLVGGVESMSNSSYALSYFKNRVRKILNNQQLTYKDIEGYIEENDMPFVGEMLSRKYGISRKEQDEFTLVSHKKAQLAKKEKYFEREVFGINLTDKDRNDELNTDEMIKSSYTMELLTNEEPFFLKDGYVTKYNSAPIGDAAAAVVLMSERMAKSQGIKPLAEIYKMNSIGLPYEKMGLGTSEAIKSILDKSGLNKNNISLFEYSEAFAVQAIITQKMLDLDTDKINVNGGSIALGYPVGCTGLRMSVTLLYEMIRRQAEFGLVAMCAGGLMGQSIIFKQ